MAWTEQEKQTAKQMYLDANPTADTSIEVVKQIAETLTGQSVNGIRMVLMQEGVYIKKDPAAAPAGKTAGGKAEGTKRVSKEDQISELSKAIEAAGADVDSEILSKLTGKAAAYFTSVLAKATEQSE